MRRVFSNQPCNVAADITDDDDDDDDDELSDGDWTDDSEDASIDSADATSSGDERDCLI